MFVFQFIERRKISVCQFVINILESENTTWVMAFNTNDEILKNNKIRRAFAYAIDKSLLSSKIEDNFRIADAFVPPSVTLNGQNYRKTVGESFAGFDFKISKRNFNPPWRSNSILR